MMISALLVAVAVFSIVDARPGVHHYTKVINGGSYEITSVGSPVFYEAPPTITATNVETDNSSGVKRKSGCGNIAGTVNDVANGLTNTVQNIEGGVNDMTKGGKGIVGGVAKGAAEGIGGVIAHGAQGIGGAMADAACGLGNMADAAMNGLKTGHLVEGAMNVGKEFMGGLANMGEDLVENGIGALRNIGSGLVDAFL